MLEVYRKHMKKCTFCGSLASSDDTCDFHILDGPMKPRDRIRLMTRCLYSLPTGVCAAVAFFAASTCFSAMADDDGAHETIYVKQPLVRHPDRVELSFAIAGRIKDLCFEEGDVVKVGTVLASLHNEQELAELALQIAKAEAVEPLEVAGARRNMAQKALQQAKDGNEILSNAIPSHEIRRLELDFEIAQAEYGEKVYEQRLAVLEKDVALAAYESTLLIAPFTGTITRRLLSKGATVDGLKTVGQIVDTSKIRIEGYVEIREAQALKKGDTILVTQKSGREVSVPLEFIDIGAQQVQKLIRVWGQTSDQVGLLEGEEVTATIRSQKAEHFGERSSAAAEPASARQDEIR